MECEACGDHFISRADSAHARRWLKDSCEYSVFSHIRCRFPCCGRAGDGLGKELLTCYLIDAFDDLHRALYSIRTRASPRELQIMATQGVDPLSTSSL